MEDKPNQKVAGGVNRFRRGFFGFLLILLSLAATAPSTFAAARTWDGGGTDAFWDTVNNWNNNALPANGDNATFGSAFTSGTAINLNGNRTVSDLAISTLSAFSITNSTLTLTSGSLTRSDIAGTEADQTIASAIVLGADGNWNIAGSGTLLVSGVISGAKKLNKNGTGSLTLTGNNTFSGTFKLDQGGTIAVGHNNALGTGTVDLKDGTIQAYGGPRTIGNDVNISGNFTIGGSQDITFSGDAALAVDATITVDNSANSTFSGNVLGAHKLYKDGNGTLILSGTNSQNETYVNAGVLSIRNANALGGTKKTAVASGAALEVQGGIAIGNETIEISGSGINNGGALRNVSGANSWAGAVTLKAASTIASDSGTLTLSSTINNGGFTATFGGAGDVTANGIISGLGGLVKEGAGTLTLGGTSANTYSGTTVVNGGTLLLAQTAGLNAYNGTLTIGDGVGGANADVVRLGANNQLPTTAITINSSGLLDLNGYSDTIGTLTLNGGNVASGAGTLTLGGDLTANANGSMASVSGNLNIGGNRYFSVFDGALDTDMEISASISGTGWLDKYYDGRLLLSGSNSYAGIMYVEGGQLRISNSNALGTTAGGTEIYTSGGSLELAGNIAVGNEALSLKGSGTNGSGSLLNVSGTNSWAGTINLATASTIGSDAGQMTLSGSLIASNALTFTGAGDTVVSGIISGSGALTKLGSGTLTLSGANTYTSTTIISNGAINVQNSAALGSTAAGTTVRSGAALQVQGGVSFASEALTINGSGVSNDGALRNISGSNAWNGVITQGSASTIGSDAGTLNIAGTLVNGGFTTTVTGAGNVLASTVISGSGGLTKTGSGTLTLGAANTFTGVLAINGGTLLLGAANRVADTVNVSMGGGKLSTGGNNETVGTLTLTANSIIDFGNANSVLHFSASVGTTWTASTILLITNWTGTYAGGGSDQLFFGSGITGLSGVQLGQIQFVDNAGHRQLANILSNGEVVPIPEPATVLAVILVAALLAYRERKQLRLIVPLAFRRRVRLLGGHLS